MKCKQVREEIFELLSGTASPTAEEHLRSCAECARELRAMRATLSLMDEWQAPEPSPYFASRLKARLRDEAAQPRTLREWLRDAFSPFTLAGRRTVLAGAMALLVTAGVTLFNVNKGGRQPEKPLIVHTGTAVADLQALDKNQDLYADFDLLDDINGAEVAQANP
jgi:hypothetical protein